MQSLFIHRKIFIESEKIFIDSDVEKNDLETPIILKQLVKN